MDSWAANQKLPFTKKRLSKRVLLSYIFDYIIVIGLVGAFYVLDKVEPFNQPFSLANYTLHYPFAVKERIPVPFLVVLVIFVPAGVIAVYTLIIDGLFSHQASMSGGGIRRKLSGRYRFKDRLWELNCGILGLLLASSFAFTVTGALKNAIGKPRPDLLDRCKPPPGLKDPEYGLTTSKVCTQTDHAIMKDGFKSFPSGHSSSAFAGLFYLSLYLAAKLHVLDSKGEVWKSFIVMCPTIGAALIAGSRIMDARHHPFDVISGSMLGILTAWGAYRQYFPPLSETWKKGRAYPIRAWGKQPAPPEHAFYPGDVTESLRAGAAPPPLDEERPDSSDNNGNVFRQQIHASQRKRDGNMGTATGASPGRYPSSSYSVATAPTFNQENAPPMPANAAAISRGFTQQPVMGSGMTHRTRPRDEHYYESSSDDEQSYELQQQYTLSGGGDTSYRPTARTTSPLNESKAPQIKPIGPISPPTTDLGEAQRSRVSPEQRGVQLHDNMI